MKKLNQDVGNFNMHYDDASKVVFVVNKGSSYTSMFHLDEHSSNEPVLAACDRHNDGKSALYTYFMPKRFVDSAKNELVRGLKFTGKTAQFVSFKIPRRDNNFAEELFPPYPAGSPSMNHQ